MPTESPRDEIQTLRLRLIALDAAALEALVALAPTSVERRLEVRFPTPYAPPPLMEDALPTMLQRVRDAAAVHWWRPWLLARASDGQVVGGAGFAGPPDAYGALQIGYAVYEHHQRQGYAPEAAGALIDWAWRQAGVTCVRATIPPWHEPSLSVARRLGMRHVGEGHDDEVGVTHIYEISAPSKPIVG